MIQICIQIYLYIEHPISAIDYLENKYVKTKAYMIDVEHYDTPIHEKIAKEYLPFVKKHLTKT